MRMDVGRDTPDACGAFGCSSARGRAALNRHARSTRRAAARWQKRHAAVAGGVVMRVSLLRLAVYLVAARRGACVRCAWQRVCGSLGGCYQTRGSIAGGHIGLWYWTPWRWWNSSTDRCGGWRASRTAGRIGRIILHLHTLLFVLRLDIGSISTIMCCPFAMANVKLVTRSTGNGRIAPRRRIGNFSTHFHNLHQVREPICPKLQPS